MKKLLLSILIISFAILCFADTSSYYFSTNTKYSENIAKKTILIKILHGKGVSQDKAINAIYNLSLDEINQLYDKKDHIEIGEYTSEDILWWLAGAAFVLWLLSLSDKRL